MLHSALNISYFIVVYKKYKELPIFSATDLECDQWTTCLSASSVETAVPSGFA